MITDTETLPRVEEPFVEIIARELKLRPRQVAAADGLFAGGSTVPFVARYRKEATGGVGDGELEQIFKRREYFLELAGRRDAILASVSGQGKLTPELERAIRAAATKQELEDLYLPWRPKRRSRAQAARERGLEPLAGALLARAGESVSPGELALPFADPARGVASAEEAIAGARDILAERIAESAEHRRRLREAFSTSAVLRSRVAEGKEEKGAVFRDYFDHHEPLKKAPSHRLLAILRGERARVLAVTLEIDDEREIERLALSWNVPLDTPCGLEVLAATRDGYSRLLRPSIANEVRAEARQHAEAEAIRVFRENLEALLMQPPLGQLAVMGIDPGYRTGCKVAVVDATGKIRATSTIFPNPPGARPEEAAATVSEFIAHHGVRAVAIGNGTGSRETERFIRGVVRARAETLGEVTVAVVPETGASVYSASALAREELPELDVAHRGAVSIARRLQDPLAELVKIEPRSLGVGQYQHDVDQKSLARELDLAVEGVVNRVGVDLNTASAALLRRVSGLSERLARSLVEHRNEHGAFPDRRQLLNVSGLGPRTFEQAAGFLRIRNHPPTLDSTAVHPERYGLVEAMARDLHVAVADLIGSPELISKVDFGKFIDQELGVGEYTLADIRGELERPGRDPRPAFRAPVWRDDVTEVGHLEPGMVLEGRVSNVTNFGAFVDIGVKRDGLVHLSELSHRWVQDPREVVHVGDVVKVTVVEVDRERERITLSMKALAPAPPEQPRRKGRRKPKARARNDGQQPRKEPRKEPQRVPEKVTRQDLDDLLARFKRRW